MRKLFIVLLGLVALGVQVAPAVAVPTSNPTSPDLPLLEDYTPPQDRGGPVGQMHGNRNYQAVLSGTLLRRASAVETTTYLFYEGGCVDRDNDVWAPQSTPKADSLNTMAINALDPYSYTDQSANEKIWSIVDATVTPYDQRGGRTTEMLIGDGARALWMGKYDPNYVGGVNDEDQDLIEPGVQGYLRKAGYPNTNFQILYVDSRNGLGGVHAGNWTFTFDTNQSLEFNYDFFYIIGGGANAADPLGQDKSGMRKVINDHQIDPTNASDAGHDLLLQITGTLLASHAGSFNTVPGGGADVATVTIDADQTLAPPDVYDMELTIEAEHRALYVVVTSDCLFSTEDGSWPVGNGVIIDNLRTSDSGVIFNEEPPVGTPAQDASNGNVLKGTAIAPILSARVGPGVGPTWLIKDGTFAGTPDACSPEKNLGTDHMFFGADLTTKDTLPGEFQGVQSCTFPLPHAFDGSSLATLITTHDEYRDLPSGSGMVEDAEFRYFASGTWSEWKDTTPGQGSVGTGAFQSWLRIPDNLAEATSADSVQMRYMIRCIVPFAVGDDCTPVRYGLLYDNFSLRTLSGTPAPVFDIFVGIVPQTTFVDGTMGFGLAAAGCPPLGGGGAIVTPCWPGVRGSGRAAGLALDDNVNNPFGDSIRITMATGLAENGLGINWHMGFDKSDASGGRILTKTNPNYNAAFDTPRLIFRLFDPASRTWSPWDSSEMHADNVLGTGAASNVVNSAHRWDWPPKDKVDAGASLPGGFTIGGFKWGAATRSAYADLAFLPAGTRMQSYYKSVDINGGVSVQFQSNAAAREVEDLPTLPGSANIAPDIISWEVLPRRYEDGSTGSLAQGSDRSPILNWDSQYTSWDYQTDPVTQALRGMGVRADRYRYLQGLGTGSNVGGHAFPGQLPRERGSNHTPNMQEYFIKDSLAAWYRIMIIPTHDRNTTVLDDQDSQLLTEWYAAETDPTLFGNGSAPHGGDRCVLMTGDDGIQMLLNPVGGTAGHEEQTNLADDVFGVSSVIDSWDGALSTPYATVDDKFAAPIAAAGLAADGTFTYPLDGGCSGIGPNRFDGLVKGSSVSGGGVPQDAVKYPLGTEVAGVSVMTERDGSNDSDNSKAMSYAYSIQFIRQAGIPTSNSNYNRSGVENRMRVLYKFLTSCRAAGVHAGECWPCPTDPAFSMTANWAGGAANAAFQTTTFGALYPIQDVARAAGAEVSEAPRVNELKGNFPNPFNPETAIRFSSATKGKITVRIFNVAGQVVHTITRNAEQGPNEIRWNGKASDGRTLASGIYFYRIRFADGSETASRMALLK